jgi:DNA mismatch repair ATPase MutS
VRQVRRMVEATQAGRRFFALIDEPFRGTNSPERVAAASAVISALIDGSGLQLVATHDAALTTLGERPLATNRHFQESLDQGQMVFDYKLRPGPARSRNALNVLEAEGYPPRVVAEARQLLSGLIEPDTRLE